MVGSSHRDLRSRTPPGCLGSTAGLLFAFYRLIESASLESLAGKEMLDQNEFKLIAYIANSESGVLWVLMGPIRVRYSGPGIYDPLS